MSLELPIVLHRVPAPRRDYGLAGRASTGGIRHPLAMKRSFAFAFLAELVGEHLFPNDKSSLRLISPRDGR